MQARLALQVSALTLGTFLALAGAPVLAQSPSGLAASPGPTVPPAPSAVPALGPAPSPPVGTEWVRTLDQGGDQGIDEVVAWKGGFVALGGQDRRMHGGSLPGWGPTLRTSPDGLTWTLLADPFGPRLDPYIVVQRLVPFGDLLIAAGSDGRRLVLWTSRNGRTWTLVPDGPVLSSGGVPQGRYVEYALEITGAAATASRVVIVGRYEFDLSPTYTRVWTSTDGRHWQRDEWTGVDPAGVGRFTAAEDRFLALVCCGTADAEGRTRSLMAMSTDGSAWSVLGAAPDEHVDRVAWSAAHGVYLAAGGQQLNQEREVSAATLWSSPDGATWTLRAQGPPDQSGRAAGLLVDGPAVLLAGRGETGSPTNDRWSWTTTSTDVDGWRLSAGWPDMGGGCMEAFAAAAGRTVAVGTCTDPKGSSRATAWVADVPRSALAAARRWGPLAVVRDRSTGGLDAGLGPGRLVITDRCVYLAGSRGVGMTLVWRSGQTRWDAKHRQIVYHDRDLGDIRLSNGDRLMLGGYGIGSAASPDNVEVPIGPWIKEADGACPARRWVAQQVDPQGR